MTWEALFLTIVGMALVTFIPRMIPALALSSRDLPPALERFLAYVPTTVLAALLLPSLLVQDGNVALELNNVFLWASVPCFVLCWKTKSFFGTVAMGMGLVALLRYALGG